MEVGKKYTSKYMLVYVCCIPLGEGYFVVKKHTTEIHACVSSLCTGWELSDLKYTTRYTAVYLVV